MQWESINATFYRQVGRAEIVLNTTLDVNQSVGVNTYSRRKLYWDQTSSENISKYKFSPDCPLLCCRGWNMWPCLFFYWWLFTLWMRCDIAVVESRTHIMAHLTIKSNTMEKAAQIDCLHFVVVTSHRLIINCNIHNGHILIIAGWDNWEFWNDPMYIK